MPIQNRGYRFRKKLLFIIYLNLSFFCCSIVFAAKDINGYQYKLQNLKNIISVTSIKITWDHNLCYALTPYFNKIYEIDLDKNEIKNTIDLWTRYISDFLVVGNKYVLLSLPFEDRLDLYDINRREIYQSIYVDDYPLKINESQDKNIGIVVNYFGNSITLIDLNNRSLIDKINTDKSPIDAMMTSDNKNIYICSRKNNNVKKYRLSDHKLLKEVKVGKSPINMAFSPNEKYLYVLSEMSHDISIIDTDRDQIIENINVGTYPSSMDISNNGKFIFVTDVIENNLEIINTSTRRIVQIIRTDEFPSTIKLIPNTYDFCLGYYGEYPLLIANKSTGAIKENKIPKNKLYMKYHFLYEKSFRFNKMIHKVIWNGIEISGYKIFPLYGKEVSDVVQGKIPLIINDMIPLHFRRMQKLILIFEANITGKIDKNKEIKIIYKDANNNELNSNCYFKDFILIKNEFSDKFTSISDKGQEIALGFIFLLPTCFDEGKIDIYLNYDDKVVNLESNIFLNENKGAFENGVYLLEKEKLRKIEDIPSYLELGLEQLADYLALTGNIDPINNKRLYDLVKFYNNKYQNNIFIDYIFARYFQTISQFDKAIYYFKKIISSFPLENKKVNIDFFPRPLLLDTENHTLSPLYSQLIMKNELKFYRLSFFHLGEIFHINGDLIKACIFYEESINAGLNQFDKIRHLNCFANKQKNSNLLNLLERISKSNSNISINLDGLSCGKLFYEFPFFSGKHQFIVSAKGEPAKGEFPIMEFKFNNKLISRVSVAPKIFKDYYFDFYVSEPGIFNFSFEFINDYYNPKENKDRNLYLEKILLKSKLS